MDHRIDVHQHVALPSSWQRFLGHCYSSKSGNRPAFVKLWKRYSNTAFQMVHQILGNRDHAEDLIQGAWVKAYVDLIGKPCAQSFFSQTR
jgi:hypothetical protein